MDDLRPWYGAIFSLDQVYSYIKSLPKEQKMSKNNHELFITWALAKCMTSRNKKQYMVGLPFDKEFPQQELSELMQSKNQLDEDFDKIIVDFNVPGQPLRIQIKRYIKSEGSNTADFFSFVKSKVLLYGENKTLNIVFDIQAALKLDIRELGSLLNQHEFKVGSIFIYFLRGIKPTITQLHPEFTGVYFTPV